MSNSHNNRQLTNQKPWGRLYKNVVKVNYS